MLKDTLMPLVVTYVLPPVLTAVGLGAAWLLGQGGRWLASKVKNEKVAGVLNRLFLHVETAVRDVEQTMRPLVRKAAEDGKITEVEQKALRDAAITKVKEHLGLQGLKSLPAILGFSPEKVDEFIGSHVEAAVNRLKVEQAPALVAGTPVEAPKPDPS